MENFKDPKLASVYTADMRDYVSQLDGSHDLGSKLRRMASDGNKWCKSWSNYIFKKIKLSHWSENAKMLVICIFALGIPAVISTYAILTAVLYFVYEVSDTFCSKNRKGGSFIISRQPSPHKAASIRSKIDVLILT